MATRPPPQTKTILATPINVEESKAQRQQRSQARFRDRGGIFVPSNRNTLAEILLGKAPPLTKPRRSVSASPALRRQSKGDSKSSPRKSNATYRKPSASPTKKGRKSTNDGTLHAATPSSIPNTTFKEAEAGSSTHAEQPNQKAKARRSSTKGSKKADLNTTEHEHATTGPTNLPAQHSEVQTKPRVSKKSAGTGEEPHLPKGKSKGKAKAIDKHARDELLEKAIIAPNPPKKSISKAAGKSSSKAKVSAPKRPEPLDNQQDEHPNPGSKASTVHDVAPVASSSSLAGPSASVRGKRRKSGDLYSCGESEDEYVPKDSKKKKAGPKKSSAKEPTKMVKPAVPEKSTLAAIMEEDEDEEVPLPARGPEVYVAESNPKKPSNPKAKGRITSAKTKKAPKAPVDPPPLDVKATNPKGGKSHASSSKGKEPPLHVEEPTDTGNNRTSSTKLNKRRVQDVESPEEGLEPPPKRVKSAAKKTPNPKSNSNSNSNKAASNKRPRDQDDVDDAVDNNSVAPEEPPKKKSAKRTKTVSEPTVEDTSTVMKTGKEMAPTATVTKSKAKPASKNSKKDSKSVKKPTEKPAKQAVTGQKQNSASEKALQPQVQVVKRGPPQSVLARIKALSQTHDIDNDPDEIDFLS